MGSAGAVATDSSDYAPKAAVPSRHVGWILAGLLLAAAVLRCVPLVARSYVGDADQVAYLAAAEGLLHGQYPTGDFGPGFGAIVALFRLAGVPLLWAGQAASVCLGLVLVYLCFALARRLYGPAAGLAMAFVVVVHAGFVDSSISGMSESALLVALIGAILLLVSAGDKPSAKTAGLIGAAAGLLFGFGYLVRPDGALYAAVLCASWLILAKRMNSHAARARVGAAAALAVTIAIVGLNTFAIWRETGEVRPQQRRMGQASAYDIDSVEAREQALFAILSGEETPSASPNLTPAARVKRLVHNSYASYAHAVPEALDPLLMAVAGFGVFLLLLNVATRWQTVGIASAWLVFPALSAAYAARMRHVCPLVAITLLWAAYGIWAASRLSWAGDRLRPVAPLVAKKRMAVICALILLVQLKPNADLTQAALNGEVPKEEKTAGQWLREHAPAGSLVLERKSVVGWYAGLTSIVPPATSLADILRFAAEKHARYLIVSERRMEKRPFLRPLLDPSWHGSPSLRRVYETPLTRREPMKLVVYEVGNSASTSSD